MRECGTLKNPVCVKYGIKYIRGNYKTDSKNIIQSAYTLASHNLCKTKVIKYVHIIHVAGRVPA